TLQSPPVGARCPPLQCGRAARADRLYRGPVRAASEIEPYSGSPDTSRIPYTGSFITISNLQRERGRHPAHGSSALVKEGNNAGLVGLVTHGQHVVSVRDIERGRPRN